MTKRKCSRFGRWVRFLNPRSSRGQLVCVCGRCSSSVPSTTSQLEQVWPACYVTLIRNCLEVAYPASDEGALAPWLWVFASIKGRGVGRNLIRTRADDFFSSFTHLEKRLRTIGCTNPLTGREGQSFIKTDWSIPRLTTTACFLLAS